MYMCSRVFPVCFCVWLCFFVCVQMGVCVCVCVCAEFANSKHLLEVAGLHRCNAGPQYMLSCEYIRITCMIDTCCPAMCLCTDMHFFPHSVFDMMFISGTPRHNRTCSSYHPTPAPRASTQAAQAAVRCARQWLCLLKKARHELFKN